MAAVAAACNSSNSETACDTKVTSGTNVEEFCQQLTGITSDEASAFDTYCTFFAGTANGGITTVVSSCSPTGSVGTCVNSVVFSGQTVTGTTYYYAPGYTAASASSVCATASGVWTAN